MPSLKDKTVARAAVSESALTRRQSGVPGEPPPAPAAGAATIDISPDSPVRGTSGASGLMHSTLPVMIFDAELRISWANEAAAKAACGGSAAHWRGRPLGEVMPGIDVGPIEQSLRAVLHTGCPALDLRVGSPPGGTTSGGRFWSCLQFPVRAPDGGCTGVVHVMWEVSQRARDERQQALANLASARIGTTLDVTRTAEELIDAAVPCLADVGAVDLLDTVIKGDGPARQATGDRMRLRRVAMRRSGGWRAAPADYACGTWPDADPAGLYHQHLASGQPVFMPAFGTMSTKQLRRMDSGLGPQLMTAARAAGAHSLIAVPLTARGVIVGLVILYRLRGSRPFTQADLSLAQDLAGRTALAIDNARLYMRERDAALALQRGLLPREIPEVPGLDLAHRYVPAQSGAEAGGDWFDVITLDPSRCALVVGDVTGHDMRAASVMGQLRTATRTLATLDLTPAEILTRLDLVAADLTDEETSATCVYAVYDAGTREWEIARAGHPLPAVVSPGSEARFLDLPPGMPLGACAGAAQYQSIRVRLPRESTVVLYTDGLIENRTDIGTGMARLAGALTQISALPVAEACDSLLTTLTPDPADDIAVLMART
ncbi:MAG TPA: SpoIIE family protein phosphatase [Streptosporangiaceae bacterium]